MPKPTFAMLLVIVIAAAGITVFAAVNLGLPLKALALGAAIGAAVVYLKRRKS